MLLCFFLRAEESKKLPPYEEGVFQSLCFVKASKPERGGGPCRAAPCKKQQSLPCKRIALHDM